jgi:hypothetical protein
MDGWRVGEGVRECGLVYVLHSTTYRPSHTYYTMWHVCVRAVEMVEGRAGGGAVSVWHKTLLVG